MGEQNYEVAVEELVGTPLPQFVRISFSAVPVCMACRSNADAQGTETLQQGQDYSINSAWSHHLFML